MNTLLWSVKLQLSSNSAGIDQPGGIDSLTVEKRIKCPEKLTRRCTVGHSVRVSSA